MTPEQDALDLARRVKSQWAGTPFKDGWPPVAEHAFILASALLSLAAQRDELRGENEELRYDDGVRRNLTELLLSEQRQHDSSVARWLIAEAASAHVGADQERKDRVISAARNLCINKPFEFPALERTINDLDALTSLPQGSDQ
jgi:hypothetical protein